MTTAPAVRRPTARHQVVLCSCGRGVATRLRAALESPDLELEHCRPDASILEEVIRRRPAVLLYELHETRHSDLAVLQLLRRAVPDVRLVLIGSGTFETERIVRDLRPVYFAMQPVDEDEMIEAVRSALGEQERRRA